MSDLDMNTLRTLSDAEWCELCLLVMDLDETTRHLQTTLLAEERPTVEQLWQVLGRFQRSSDSFLDYMSVCLRERMLHGQRAA